MVDLRLAGRVRSLGRLILFWILMPWGFVRAQGPGDPNEGTRLEYGGSPGTFRFSWWGRAERLYFIQRCEDLAAGRWVYEPVLETGSNGALAWRFDSAFPPLYLRLKPTGGLPNTCSYRDPLGIWLSAGLDWYSRVR